VTIFSSSSSGFRRTWGAYNIPSGVSSIPVLGLVPRPALHQRVGRLRHQTAEQEEVMTEWQARHVARTLAGGMQAWAAAGHPVQNGKPDGGLGQVD
jgi:hypothetical protein